MPLNPQTAVVAPAGSATDPQPVVEPARRWPVWLARVLLAGAGCLLVWPWQPPWEGAVPPLSPALAGWLGSADRWSARGTEAVCVLALGLMTGVLGWWALPGRGARWWRQPVRWVALVGIVGGLALARHATPLGLCLAVLTAVVGGWGFLLGAAVDRGPGRALAFTTGTVLLLAGGGAWLLSSALAAEPTVAGMPTPTAADRARWKSMLTGARDQERHGPVELRLTRDDLNLMAASWLAARRGHTAVDCAFADKSLTTRVSVPCHVPGLGRRFVNLELVSRPQVADGRIALRLARIQAGSLSVPPVAAAPLSRAVSKALNADPDLRRWGHAVDALEIAGDQLIIQCDPAQASRAIAAAGEPATTTAPELTATVRIYLGELVARAGRLPPGDERFVGLVRTAFEIARERSRPETAVLENQAALVALGIQFGDPRVRRLAGFPPEEPITMFRYPFDRKVTLRDRNDLARHFFVSSALRALSTGEVSFAVGLIKEQLDAAEGGSGFSFADLAADLAGVQFAHRATQDPSTAVALQTRLAEPFGIDDLMPEFDGLPENLTQEEFAARYGSLTDPRFLQLTAEIQRRFADCELLKVDAQGPPATPP